LLLSACLALGGSALNWAGASETDSGPKTAGPKTGGPLPPAEQRFFDKSALVQPVAIPSLFKAPPAGRVSGVLPPGEVKASKKTVASPAAVPAQNAANPALGPVSGQASPEELRGYQKPGDSSGAVSVLILPVTAPAPGAGKVAMGTVAGPASPEELRGYVKPAVLPATDASQPARAPTSGTVPSAEQLHFQK
jgi:hypothetical protein